MTCALWFDRGTWWTFAIQSQQLLQEWIHTDQQIPISSCLVCACIAVNVWTFSYWDCQCFLNTMTACFYTGMQTETSAGACKSNKYRRIWMYDGRRVHVWQGAVWERWRNGGTWMKSAVTGIVVLEILVHRTTIFAGKYGPPLKKLVWVERRSFYVFFLE